MGKLTAALICLCLAQRILRCLPPHLYHLGAVAQVPEREPAMILYGDVVHSGQSKVLSPLQVIQAADRPPY